MFLFFLILANTNIDTEITLIILNNQGHHGMLFSSVCFPGLKVHACSCTHVTRLIVNVSELIFNEVH